MRKMLAFSVETPHPRSSGVQFEDVYISDENDSYAGEPASPRNDCYIYLSYRLKVNRTQFRNSPYTQAYATGLWSERGHPDMLKDYLKTTYWGK